MTLEEIRRELKNIKAELAKLDIEERPLFEKYRRGLEARERVMMETQAREAANGEPVTMDFKTDFVEYAIPPKPETYRLELRQAASTFMEAETIEVEVEASDLSSAMIEAFIKFVLEIRCPFDVDYLEVYEQASGDFRRYCEDLRREPPECVAQCIWFDKDITFYNEGIQIGSPGYKAVKRWDEEKGLVLSAF